MTTRESLNFSTANPIPANGFFAPVIWDDCLNFSSVLVSINTTGAPVVLTVEQSSDRVNISSIETVNIYANELYNNSFQLYARFFKLRLDNPSGTAQTTLNCQVIFKNLVVPQMNIRTIQVFSPATSTGVNGVSASINLNQRNANLTVFGNIDAGTVLTLQLSNDDVNYYDSQYSLTTSSAQDFGFSVPTSSIYYMRLKSSNDVNILAIVNFS
jgi:hypothetical protein